MKSVRAILKKPKALLALALALILIGSVFAFLVNTSFLSVKVTEITFEGGHGTLHGLLYMPKGAGADDPRPVVITTHGYLNTKEMQTPAAVEMSRRGYIVLALDMYDHGDSQWADDIVVGEQFGTFWIHAQFDATQYIYSQDYTKKDAEGNGYIAVSGHSMGGFSSLVAMYMDEMTSLQTGTRMIYAGIPVGADFMYAEMLAPQADLQAAYGNRTVGMIGAHYDEFFFNKSEDEMTEKELKAGGTVMYKDYVETAKGKQFLGLDASASAEAGQFYTVESGAVEIEGMVVRESQSGQHIVYTPNENHQWNHFSRETTGNLIDFYTAAFEGVRSENQTKATLSSSNQIWMLKEAATLVSMLGFFMLMVALAALLVQKVPFFKWSKTEDLNPLPQPEKKRTRILFWVLMIVSALLPAILYPYLMDKDPSALKAFWIISLILAVCAALVGAFGIVKNKKDTIGRGGLIAGGVLGVLTLLLALADHIVPLNTYFTEPVTSQIAYWAIICGLISAVFVICAYYFSFKRSGVKFENYGISKNWKVIAASFCTAVVCLVVGYALLFLIESIFHVDFRFFLQAIRTFQPTQLIVALRYLPFLFIFYFINVVALNANTRGRKFGTWLAIFLNAGGLLIWMAINYGMLVGTGIALYPTQSLNALLLFGTIPNLAFAAVMARKLFEKTQNVWLGAFLNSMLFTMMMACNTAMFWNFV